MIPSTPLLFALHGSEDYASRVANRLGLPLAALEERDFEDGEHKSRPLEPVLGRQVVVFHSLHGEAERSVNDKLCRLLFFCGALRDAGAARVHVVAPYLCYARKERRTQYQDPIISRYVAALLEASGVARLSVIDVHNPAASTTPFASRPATSKAPSCSPSASPTCQPTPGSWRSRPMPAAPSAPSAFARPSNAASGDRSAALSWKSTGPTTWSPAAFWSVR